MGFNLIFREIIGAIWAFVTWPILFGASLVFLFFWWCKIWYKGKN